MTTFFFVSCGAPQRTGYNRETGSYYRRAQPAPRVIAAKPPPSPNSAKPLPSPSTESATAPETPAQDKDLDYFISLWLGTPYLFGGNTREGVDCSGLVNSIFRNWKGITLPRSSRASFQTGTRVSRSALRRGDVVFFGNRWGINHSGIYLGNGTFFHSSSSQGVVITPMSDSYWSKRYRGARRYF